MTITRSGLALLALGIAFLVVALVVGLPAHTSDGVYVIRGVDAPSDAKISGPVSPADGNHWFRAAIPTILIGAGLLAASRRSRG